MMIILKFWTILYFNLRIYFTLRGCVIQRRFYDMIDFSDVL